MGVRTTGLCPGPSRGMYLLAGGIPSEKGRRLSGGRGRRWLSQQPQPTFRSSPRRMPEAAAPYKSPGSTDPGAAGNAPSWFTGASLPTFGCSRPRFFSKSVDSLKTALNKATDSVSAHFSVSREMGRPPPASFCPQPPESSVGICSLSARPGSPRPASLAACVSPNC